MERASSVESEVQAQLMRFSLSEQHRVHERAGNGTAFVWERDGDARRLTDRRGFAQDDIQDRAINRAVGRIQKNGTYDSCRLTKPVNAAFALLMARRIP